MTLSVRPSKWQDALQAAPPNPISPLAHPKREPLRLQASHMTRISQMSKHLFSSPRPLTSSVEPASGSPTTLHIPLQPCREAVPVELQHRRDQTQMSDAEHLPLTQHQTQGLHNPHMHLAVKTLRKTVYLATRGILWSLGFGPTLLPSERRAATELSMELRYVAWTHKRPR